MWLTASSESAVPGAAHYLHLCCDNILDDLQYLWNESGSEHNLEDKLPCFSRGDPDSDCGQYPRYYRNSMVLPKQAHPMLLAVQMGSVCRGRSNNDLCNMRALTNCILQAFVLQV